jgi:hypothetical protein
MREGAIMKRRINECGGCIKNEWLDVRYVKGRAKMLRDAEVAA